MTEYVFVKEEPPAKLGFGRKSDPRLDAFVQYLKDHPGEWFVWGESRHSVSYKKKYPGTEWTSRKSTATGLYKTWARYVLTGL